jgi:DNA-binding Lrp family transcriptional regulator
MDSFDFAILDALQQDARISNKELAAHIGLAPSTCLGRVRQLEQRGIIQRYVTELDPDALGIGLQAMLAIRIRVHSNRLFRAFSEYVLGLPEVRAVYHVSGNVDLLIHVVVRDAHHLRDFVLEQISSRDEVDRCETSLIYEESLRAKLPLYAAPRQT